MPFPQKVGLPYTRAVVEALPANQFGVYGLYRTDRWVYVGSGDIRDRLLKHLNGDNPRITAEHPTHWVHELTRDMDSREKELTLELNPIANQRVG